MKINLNPINQFYFGTNTRKLRANSSGEIVTNNDRRYYDSEFDKLLYENTTLFFRHDLNFARKPEYKTSDTWIGFRKTIADYFENTPKVNVYDFASSDGSEAYSLITCLIDELGEKGAQKFFPIQAYDIDSAMVEQAKSGEIPCNIDDIRRINENLKQMPFYLYFNFEDYNGSLPYLFIATDRLKQKVNFNLADIQSTIKNIQPSNSLILCRNFWPYLSKEDRDKTIFELSQKLDDSSLVVIGSFDNSQTINQFLKCGFVDIHPFIFKKMPNNSF